MIPEKLKRTTIYESPWVNLYKDRVKLPSGTIIEEYHQVEIPRDSVVVLLRNKKNEICMIKSLRYSTQCEQWELPAGAVKADEEILTAAEREVREETGLETEGLECVYTFNPVVGISNHEVHVVFGSVKDGIKGAFDTDEVKEVRWFTQDEIMRMITRKEIRDGVSLMPLMLNRVMS